MRYPPFEHEHIIDSRIVEKEGRKVLVIRTMLPLNEDQDGFDVKAMSDLRAAFGDYVKRYPGISECHLVRLRH